MIKIKLKICVIFHMLTALKDDIYSIFSRSGPVCKVNSILELWSYNEAIIRNLSSSDILQNINRNNIVR